MEDIQQIAHIASLRIPGALVMNTRHAKGRLAACVDSAKLSFECSSASPEGPILDGTDVSSISERVSMRRACNGALRTRRGGETVAAVDAAAARLRARRRGLSHAWLPHGLLSSPLTYHLAPPSNPTTQQTAPLVVA